MAIFTEVSYTSAFDIQSNGCIAVRTTTNVLKDGVVISTNYNRTMLVPNDPRASTVLNEAYYANLANAAWTPEVIAAYQAQVAKQSTMGA